MQHQKNYPPGNRLPRGSQSSQGQANVNKIPIIPRQRVTAEGGVMEGGSQPPANTPLESPKTTQTPQKEDTEEMKQMLRWIMQTESLLAQQYLVESPSPLDPQAELQILRDRDAAKTQQLQSAKAFYQGQYHIQKETEPTAADILREVQLVKEILKRSLRSPPQPTQRTWAQLAATNIPLAPKAQNSLQTPEITIRIADPQDRQQLATLSNETIVQRINSSTAAGGKDVIAARKLPSGDLKLFLRTKQAQTSLQEGDVWRNILGVSASPAQILHPVLVHGVRIANVDTRDPNMPKKIQSENKNLHGSLQIVKLAWLKKNIEEGKAHSSLIVYAKDTASANKMIQKGLVIDYALHNSELYHSDFYIKQCFKCQAYGHIAPHCGRSEKCGKCASSHATQACTENNRKKCGNCGRNHASWSGQCTIRIAAKAKAAVAKQAAPSLYPESAVTVPFAFTTGGKRKTDQTTSTPIPIAKRGPGRPRDLDRPNPPSQQTIQILSTQSTQTEESEDVDMTLLYTQDIDESAL